MDKTQIIVADVVGIIVVLAIAVGALFLLRSFMRRLQSGHIGGGWLRRLMLAVRQLPQTRVINI
jgi:hypothetical protein